MSIFDSLLKEAIDNKPFETIGDLKIAIKTVLNRHSRLSINGNDEAEFDKFGFKFKTYKREFKLKIFGDNSHKLLGEFKREGIHCKYSSMDDTITIRYEDNVSVSGLLSEEAQDEIENNTWGVIGWVTDKEDFIPDSEMFDTQERIYNELMKYRMIEWKPNGKHYKLVLRGI